MSPTRRSSVVIASSCLFALAALSGCDAGKVCEPSALRCSALENRVEQCNADGSAFETVATCPGNTCAVKDGVPACAGPEPVCTPGETRCSDLRNRVEVCAADGSAFETSATCEGNTCVVESGLARCDGPELVCSPGETRCDEEDPSVVETCAADGSGFVGSACAGGLACVASGAAARCQMCAPGTTQCGANNASVEVCNALGTAFERTDTCTGSSCKLVDGAYACELPCTPGHTRCGLANQTVQVCSAAGDAYEVAARCLDQSCAVDGVVATCRVPEACVPGGRRCSALAANLIEACSADATGWVGDETCPGRTECTTAGGGVGCQACVPGAKRCGPQNGSLETCNAAGTAFEKTMTCSASSCGYIGGDYRCALPCTPGETRCAQTNQIVEVCDAAGAAYTEAEKCALNSCATVAGRATCGVPRVCTVGERRCSATHPNQIEQCNSQGTGWYVSSTCGGELTCIGAGACQTCVPGATSCGANNGSVVTCNAAGTGFELAETCATSSCEVRDGAIGCKFPCTPGEKRCSPLKNRIDVCDAGGATFSTAETCTNNSCGETPAGPVCNAVAICTPGAKRCSATDPGVVEQCGATGTAWFAQSRCGGGLVCSTASGAAACQSCVPGSELCGAQNGSVVACDASGAGFTTVETCASASCRVVDGVSDCDLPCTPGATRCSASGSQVQVCSAAGDAWQVGEPCVGDSCTVSGPIAYCEVAQVCTPGARRCSPEAGNVVEQCSASGAGWAPATTCAGALQCTRTGATTEGCQLCVPGTRYCGANNASVMECNAAGTAFEKAADCLDNTCRWRSGAVACDLPCTPGARRCSPLKNRVDECATSGTAVTTVETCVGNSCTEAFGTATCAPPAVECEPGETRCSPLGTMVETCSDAGKWASSGSCPSADCRVLNGVAACAAPECQPNLFFCGEDGDVHGCTSSGKDSGVRRACADDETCGVLDGVAQCVPPEVPMSCVPGIQFCGEDDVIYYCDGQGRVSGIRANCDADEVCVVDASAPACIGGHYETAPDGSTTCVVDEPAACVIIPKAFTTRGFVYAESEKTSCEDAARVTRECGEQMACVGGRCASSVADTTSPYYEYACPLVQQLAYPTSLAADCRCFINNAPVSGREICGRPYDRATQGVQVGVGPRIVGLANAHYMGGVVDGDELVVAAYWGSSTAQRGAVLAIDVDSGDRRLVTGDLGTVTAGSGPALPYALDVRKGGDGKYYVFGQSTSPGAPSIFRVEPTTGARALVWRGGDAAFGQCPAGDPTAAAAGGAAQYTNQGFAVEPGGSFLVGYANAQRDGRGVVRIASNGASCAFVTATGLRADGLTRGAGPDLGGFVQGFTVDGGKVLVQTTQPKALVEIDLASGDRTVLVSTGVAGGIGERWAVKDPARGVIWTAGLMNSVTLVAYDRARNLLLDAFSSCGSAEFPWYPLCPGAGPVKINSMNYGGLWLHPRTGNLLMAQDSVSIIEFEPATANSVIRSL